MLMSEGSSTATSNLRTCFEPGGPGQGSRPRPHTRLNGRRTRRRRSGQPPASVVGTVHFMSPEQCAVIDVDCRSDLFSLGCTMYYLLTCQLPFPGDTLAECLALRIRGCQIPITDHRSDLSPRLVEVLDRFLARRPQDRFQTAGEAATALHDLADTEASSSPSPRSTPLPPTAPSVPEPVRVLNSSLGC